MAAGPSTSSAATATASFAVEAGAKPEPALAGEQHLAGGQVGDHRADVRAERGRAEHAGASAAATPAAVAACPE